MWILNEIKESLPLIDPGTHALTFTGGETLSDWENFIDVLKQCRDLLPAPSMTYAPSETNWSAKYGCTAPSVMAALGRWARSLARQQLRAKFFVQPMTAVVAPPNLPAHKPTGNCASGDDDRP